MNLTDISCLAGRIEELEKRVAELYIEQGQADVIKLTVKIDNEVIVKQVIKSINDYQKKNGRPLLGLQLQAF